MSGSDLAFMKESIPFTDEERLLASYYKTPSLSHWRRGVGFQLVQLCVSLFFISLFVVREETAWGVTGYLILAYVMVQNMFETRRWQPVMKSLIERYEAHIAELDQKLEGGKPSGEDS
jgi:hypothetical protein